MRAVGCVLLLIALGGCTGSADPLELRAARIEERLLASCSCHPRKIAGLPVEREIRTSIRSLIAEGLDDDEILWETLMAHGTELLEAGVEDVELRARVAVAESGLILLLACAVLLLQLRVRESGAG